MGFNPFKEVSDAAIKIVESGVTVVSIGTVDLDIREGAIDVGSPDIGEAAEQLSGGLIGDLTGLSGEEQIIIGGLIVGGVALAGGAGGVGAAGGGTAATGGGSSVVLPLIGIGVSIGGALLASEAQKDAAKKEQKATEQFARIQQELTVESIGSRARRNLENISFQERQDLLTSKLQNVQIRRQAAIAGARQRSAAQRSRIGGVGGTFADVRSGASELRTEVELQLFNLKVERDARAEARELSRQNIVEESQLGVTQAHVTAGGAIAGARAGATAAATRADVVATQSIIQGTTQFLTNPVVAQRINDFFNQPAAPVIQTNPTGDILVNPTVPRTA